MQLRGYSGVVGRVPGVLLRCCYAVARVPEVGCQGVAMRLLWYLGWLLGCC